MFWKNFGIFISAASALWPMPSMASALQWKLENGVYCGFNGRKEISHDYPSGLLRPTAILQMGLVNAEIRARRDGDHHEAMAYFSLPSEIQEWLKRLGLVAEEGEFFRFAHSLGVEYRVYSSIQSVEVLYFHIWDRYNMAKAVAVKLVSLRKGRVDFNNPTDQSDSTCCTQSLLNGFVLRKGELIRNDHYSGIDFDGLKKWQKIKITGHDPNKIFAFAAIVVYPNPCGRRYILRGEIRAIVYVVLSRGSRIQNAEGIERILSSLVPSGTLNCVTPMSPEQRKKNEDLLDAAKKDDIGKMHSLLQAGADVGAVNDGNYMPIHFVARNGSVEGMQELFNAETPLGISTDEHNETPLHFAVNGGHDKFVSAFLKSVPPEKLRSLLGYGDENNWTPLSIAAYGGHRAIVEMLLPHMTLEQIQIGGCDSKMAIHLAAANGYADIVELLLKHLSTRGMTQNAVSKMLKNFKYPSGFTFWMDRVRKSPSCVQILKPYVPEL
jgi:hypothetical protein